MKKQIVKTVAYCDSCDDAVANYTCLNCGKEFCIECLQTQMVEFPYSLHCGGSSAGLYCKDCCNKISNDDLYFAYSEMKMLQDQYHAVIKDIEERARKVEHKILELRQLNEYCRH